MAGKTQQNWTAPQVKYMQFVARGKTNKKGERRTDEQIAQALGVDRTTLWRWTQQPGFMQAVLDLIVKEQLLPDLPLMIQGQRQIAKGVEAYALDKNGNKKVLKPNTNAFNALMKLVQIATPQQIESTVTAEITHDYAAASDEELDAIIESGGVLAK